jgi:hypothetical protein
LATGEKRTLKVLISPGERENDPAPARIENGDAGEPIFPVMAPPVALTEKDSSALTFLKLSDFGLTISLDLRTFAGSKEAAIAKATKARKNPATEGKTTNRFIRRHH